jgi:hypothetical protein
MEGIPCSTTRHVSSTLDIIMTSLVLHGLCDRGGVFKKPNMTGNKESLFAWVAPPQEPLIQGDLPRLNGSKNQGLTRLGRHVAKGKPDYQRGARVYLLSSKNVEI